MAARTVTIHHNAQVRERIKTSQLVNRLQKHVLGKLDLSPTQIKAAETLLKKTLPDLSQVSLNASGNVNVHVTGDDASLL